jgi:hypothetical protein
LLAGEKVNCVSLPTAAATVLHNVAATAVPADALANPAENVDEMSLAGEVVFVPTCPLNIVTALPAVKLATDTCLVVLL